MGKEQDINDRSILRSRAKIPPSTHWTTGESCYPSTMDDHKIKVLFECEVCGKNVENVAEHDGYCIQSRSGGFMCKDCWKRFQNFFDDIVLTIPEEHDFVDGNEK